MGFPIADLLGLAGGIRRGRQLTAVIPGGSSVPVVPREAMMKYTMDYDSIFQGGFHAGLGGRDRDAR